MVFLFCWAVSTSTDEGGGVALATTTSSIFRFLKFTTCQRWPQLERISQEMAAEFRVNAGVTWLINSQTVCGLLLNCDKQQQQQQRPVCHRKLVGSGPVLLNLRKTKKGWTLWRSAISKKANVSHAVTVFKSALFWPLTSCNFLSFCCLLFICL